MVKKNWRNEVDPEVYKKASVQCPHETYAPCDPCLKRALHDEEQRKLSLQPDVVTKWLRFTVHRDTGKTKVWGVYGLGGEGSRSGPPYLGSIKWRGQWRKYVYEPWSPIVMDADCLRDVINFIELQMAERARLKRERVDA